MGDMTPILEIMKEKTAPTAAPPAAKGAFARRPSAPVPAGGPRLAAAQKDLCRFRPFSQKMSSLFPKICGIMTLDSIAGRSGGRDRAGARPRRSTQAGRRRSARINHAGGMSHE